MSKHVPDCLYDVEAVRLSFEIGQVLEGLLLDRSLELARQSGGASVRTDHVYSCVDEALFADVLAKVREKAHGRTAEDGGFREGGSREAA